MSIVIWGQRPRSLALAAAGVRDCARCGLAREHHQVVEYTVNHLYYIFGFVSGSQIVCRCSICGQAAATGVDPLLEARAKAAIPLTERFGCLSLAVPIAGLVLLAIAWNAWGPQPRNIPDLLSRARGGDSAAIVRLEAEAQAGDLPSQVALAQVYRDGIGVAADPERAFAWARRAAEAGSAGAQFGLGAMYEWGKGTAADPAQAAAWYRKAAAQGVAGAANSLGALYLQGSGVERDPSMAVAWFRKAAEGGDVPGQFNLAMRYFNGEGIAADPVAARRWLELAAAAPGNDALTSSIAASSKQELGVIYEEGLGVERDLLKALRFYEEASPLNEDARINFERLKARLDG